MINRKKICVIASSLANGGAEKSSATLTKMLYDLGHDVHVVTVLPFVKYDYSGELFNLGLLKGEKDSFLKRIHRFKLFNSYLKKHQFDYIIDNRSRVQAYRELIITKILYRNYLVIYVLHNYALEKTFTAYKWLNILLYKKKHFVAVSKEIKLQCEKVFQLKEIVTIYNGFNISEINKKSLIEQGYDFKINDYILYYGRIDDAHKNLKLLLKAYKLSKLPENNVKLILLGDGPDYDEIVEEVKNLDIEAWVQFKGFLANPYPFVRKALFTVLTSRYEGFPMVIPESLCLETPVISVDCKSGPKEIIENGFNGLLVENYNAKALSEAMNSFIFDKNLYKECKANARQSVEKFDVSEISHNWQALLKKLEWKEK